LAAHCLGGFGLQDHRLSAHHPSAIWHGVELRHEKGKPKFVMRKKREHTLRASISRGEIEGSAEFGLVISIV
jgi:hypothetical protein